MNLRQPELTPQQLADWLGHCPDRLAELVSISPHGRRQVKAFASGAAVMTRYDKDQLIRAMRLVRHQCVACPQEAVK